MQRNTSKAEFIRAIMDGNLSVVEQYLLDHPDTINYKYDGKMTALMVAAYHGQVAITALLLAQPHIDIHIATVNGRTATDIANERGHQEIGVAITNSNRPRNLTPAFPPTANSAPLSIFTRPPNTASPAARSGGGLGFSFVSANQTTGSAPAEVGLSISAFRRLMSEKRARLESLSITAPQAVPAARAAPDHVSAESEVEFASQLRAGSALSNAVIAAIHNGDIQHVTAFMNTNATFRRLAYYITDPANNQTALMIAARLADLEIVARLLEPFNLFGEQRDLPHEIYYEARDNLGRTALMHAALTGSLEIVAMLLLLRGVGIDHGVRDNSGRNAAELAENNGFQRVGEYIRTQMGLEARIRNGSFNPETFLQNMPAFGDRFYPPRTRLEVSQNTPGSRETVRLVNNANDRSLFGEDQATRERRLAVEDFITAARHNNREAVNDFIAANRDRPYLSANLFAAAQVAHPDTAAYLLEMHSRLEHEAHEQMQTSQEATPPSASTNRQAARLEACGFTRDVPEPLRDVSTLEIMHDPVTLSSGHTHERNSLKQLSAAVVNKVLLRNCIACPISRACVPRSEVDNSTNICMRNIIEDFICTQEDPKYKSKLVRLLLCPLSKNIMHNPVTLACGLTVDRQALIELFARHNNPDTLKIDGTLQVMRKELDTLKTNIAIQKLIATIPKEDFEAEIQKMVRERRQGLFVAAPSTDNINKGGAPAGEPRQKK